MNTITRTNLDIIPVPFEDGAPVRCMVVVSNGQYRTAWGMSGCMKPEPFGEPYLRALDATQAARHLNARGGA